MSISRCVARQDRALDACSQQRGDGAGEDRPDGDRPGAQRRTWPQIVDRAMVLAQAQRSVVFLPAGIGEQLEVAATRGFGDGAAPSGEPPLGERLWSRGADNSASRWLDADARRPACGNGTARVFGRLRWSRRSRWR